MIEIVQAITPDHIEQTRAIFREYEAWLGLSLCFQGFEQELASLPGKYTPPDGRLYLAFSDDQLAGCSALRKLEDGIGEMKRVFVREKFRGLHIGRMMIEKIISEATEIGYTVLRLDTYPPKMGKAVGMYESYGFREIPPYCNNPIGETLFMELTL